MRVAVCVSPRDSREDSLHVASGLSPESIVRKLRARVESEFQRGDWKITWFETPSRADARSDCVLVFLGDAPDSPPLWSSQLPEHVPVVILVDGDVGSTAYSLRRACVAEIIRLGDPPIDLAEIVRAAYVSGTVGKTINVIQNLRAPSDVLIEWMAAVLETYPPYSSVEKAIQQTVDRSASTIRAHWRVGIQSSGPKELVRWVLLVRAVMTKVTEGCTWDHVAARFEIHRRTLERTARTLTDSSLKELVVDSGDPVVRAFEEYAARTFLCE